MKKTFGVVAVYPKLKFPTGFSHFQANFNICCEGNNFTDLKIIYTPVIIGPKQLKLKSPSLTLFTKVWLAH